MFLTNFGVPEGSFLVARIRKQKKLQSISYLSAPEIPKKEKKDATVIIRTFPKTGIKEVGNGFQSQLLWSRYQKFTETGKR